MSEVAPPPPSGPEMRDIERPPLALIFSITVTGILANTLVVPAIPDILDSFDQPDSSAGIFVAVGALPGIFVAPVIGILADRYGRRAVLVPCLASFGLLGALSAFAPTFGWLIALRTLQGVGAAGLINLAVVLLGDHWSGRERARLVGQNAAVLTVSLAIVPPIGGLLTDLGGWRLSFAPYIVGVWTAVRIWRRLDPARPTTVGTLRSQLGGAREAIRHRDVVGSVSIGFVIFMLIFGLFLTAMPVHLESEFGLEAGLRGAVIAAPALTSTVVALRLGWLRGRFGAVRLLVGASAFFTVGFVVIGASGTLPVLITGTMLFGVGEGVFIPTLQDVVTGSAPTSQRGAVVALWVGAARAGQTIGPIAVAAIYAALGTGRTFMLGGVMALGLMIASAVGRFGAEDHGPEPAPA